MQLNKKNANKKSELAVNFFCETPEEELKGNLQPLRDELNLNLVMADPEKKDVVLLGKILQSLTSLKELCETKDPHLFTRAVSTIHGMVSTLVIDEVEYPAGISTVLELHKALEEGFESFLYNGKVPESFEKNFKVIEGHLQSKEEGTQENSSDGKTENKSVDTNKTVIQKLEDDADISMLTTFITDSIEAVENAEGLLMELENDPENTEMVNSIFRCFHSLKGAAGFLGLQDLSGLSHNAETALDSLRNGRLSATTEFVNCMLTVLDTTKQLLIQLKELIDPNIDKSKVSPVKIGEAENLLEYLNSDSALSKPASIAKRPLASQETDQADSEKIAKDKSLTLDVVKVPSPKLDELSELVGELVIALSILSHNEVITGIEDREVRDKLNQMEKTTESLRNKTLEVRMVPLESVFSRLTRQVRDLSQKLNKKVKLTTKGKETLVDKLVIDEIYSPLMHIVRNAIDHGLEDEEERIASGKPAEGNITLSAYHQGESIRIEISDDGKGLNREKILKKAQQAGIIKENAGVSDSQIFDFIFHAGFSTAEKVTNVSGRGVGMDVVKKTLENLRGKIEVTSEPGKGSTFSLRLPMTTSIIEGLVFRIGENKFIAPLLSVRQTVTPAKNELQSIHDREGQYFLYQGQLLPILRLYEYFQIEPSFKDPSKAMIIVVENGHGSYGLMVDELLHKQQVVIKNIKNRFENLQGISGGTILGNGQVGFILDPDEIVQRMKK